MAKVISIINNKGGTGKTTTALNLGAALKKKKKKVLLIDLDSQCNLSNSLGIKDPEKHVGEVLLSNCSFEEGIQHTEELDLIPSVPALLDYEYKMNSEPGREFLLKEILDQQNFYDYILLDCPPSLGTLATNSLVAATSFIVPMQAENFAFIGLDRILQNAEKVRSRMNPELALEGILMVKLQPRTKFSKAVIGNLIANPKLENKIFNNYIRQDIALMEAPAFGQSIFEYAPKSRGATDYLNVAKELLKNHG